MNRKGFLMMVVVAVLAAGNAFAQMPEFKLSAGAGGLFVSQFGGGVALINNSTGATYMEFKYPYAGGGGFAFFDATFAELSFGFFAASGDIKNVTSSSKFADISHTGLDISLLGKYPFTLSEHFTLFPLLGIDYRHIISVKTNATLNISKTAGDYSALWFKLGVGADYAFTDHIFARLGVVYGIRLKNKWEKDWEKIFPAGYTPETRLGHGLDVKLAVGYRF
jgi:opacity protein-like surface antigen